MYQSSSFLGIIPARGGSKGVPRKNIRYVAGKPLIAWTIEEAIQSKYLDRVVLSSEDDEIIKIAKTLGCEVPFVRPKELALDETPGIAPIVHAIKLLPNYNYVVVLQPTSPLRRAEDIDKCIERCMQLNAKACVSVIEPDKSPYWMFRVGPDGRMLPLLESSAAFTRRQDLPEVVALNGAVYVAECNWLLQNNTFLTDKTVAYLMPKEFSIDIDSEYDLLFAELIIRGGQKKM